MSYRVTMAVDVHAYSTDEASGIVANALSGDLRITGHPVLVDVEENDPSPYCTRCGSMTATGCDCGPRAAND